MADVLTVEQRREFLAAPRIGVLSVADVRPVRAPLAVPIWYSYDPDAGISVITGPGSWKGRAIEAARRYSLTVQDEGIPYRYVAVEGPVVDVRRCDLESDLVPMSVRYLGEPGRAYARAWQEWAGPDGLRAYVMTPVHWNTADTTPDLAPFVAAP
jgi:hypothetical protein